MVSLTPVSYLTLVPRLNFPDFKPRASVATNPKVNFSKNRGGVSRMPKSVPQPEEVPTELLSYDKLLAMYFRLAPTEI